MGKAFWTMVFSIPASILAFLMVWIGTDWNWKIGLISACAVVLIALIVALYFILTIEELGWLDVFLPVPFAIIWSIMMSPFLLIGLITGDLFQTPAFMGTALILTLSLWMVKQGDMPHKWLIIPILSFMYEMLPIYIPGSFDNLFALGGAGISSMIQFAKLTYFSQAKMFQSEEKHE